MIGPMGPMSNDPKEVAKYYLFVIGGAIALGVIFGLLMGLGG